MVDIFSLFQFFLIMETEVLNFFIKVNWFLTLSKFLLWFPKKKSKFLLCLFAKPFCFFLSFVFLFTSPTYIWHAGIWAEPSTFVFLMWSTKDVASHSDNVYDDYLNTNLQTPQLYVLFYLKKRVDEDSAYCLGNMQVTKSQ